MAVSKHRTEYEALREAAFTYFLHGEDFELWQKLNAEADAIAARHRKLADTWTEAVEAMGEDGAAIMVAAILEKGEGIKSPGGYLRKLTERAQVGQFSLGPVLMALLRANAGGAGGRRRA
jgi:replication initiation protein RepC